MHSEAEKAAIRAAVEQARAELAQAPSLPDPPKRRQRQFVVPQYSGPQMGYKFGVKPS